MAAAQTEQEGHRAGTSSVGNALQSNSNLYPGEENNPGVEGQRVDEQHLVMFCQIKMRIKGNFPNSGTQGQGIVTPALIF